MNCVAGLRSFLIIQSMPLAINLRPCITDLLRPCRCDGKEIGSQYSGSVPTLPYSVLFRAWNRDSEPLLTAPTRLEDFGTMSWVYIVARITLFSYIFLEALHILYTSKLPYS